MLRATSIRLSASIFAPPSPVFALLPALTVRDHMPSLMTPKPQPLFDPTAPHSLPPAYRRSYRTFIPKFNLFPGTADQSRISRATASFSSVTGLEGGREILVKHLLVKEDDHKLLDELLREVAEGKDLSELAVDYSICPSKEEGGMLGWVRKGQMVPEFDEAAFGAPLNKIVRCKTKFGWHLLEVLSEREESVLDHIDPSELHEKMQDPSFLEEAQLIDVREPHEVALASVPGFKVLPLQQFEDWAPQITTKFDSQKDTYVLCHHGVRSLKIAQWLQTQGFRRVINVSGGIHKFADVDPSIPTY